jgi:metal-responsive CopG/Arc/MetJ family transcriptional regulator
MKMKISITLSEDIVKSVDRLVKKGESRSEVIERLLRISLIRLARRARDLKDLEIINQYAAQLNDEAEDVLQYQVET